MKYYACFFKEQWKFWKWKNRVTKIKILMDGQNCRLDGAEKRITEIKNNYEEITHKTAER